MKGMFEFGAIVLVVFMLLWIGGLHISFDPFTIKLETWENMLATIFMAAAICLWQHSSYKKGLERGSQITKEVFLEQLETPKENSDFRMYLLRKSDPEIIETLEQKYGYLPVSSVFGKSHDSWILVAGTRYSLIKPETLAGEISEDILIDCKDNDSVFYAFLETDQNRH